jgi:hypothetical protein
MTRSGALSVVCGLSGGVVQGRPPRVAPGEESQVEEAQVRELRKEIEAWKRHAQTSDKEIAALRDFVRYVRDGNVGHISDEGLEWAERLVGCR